MAKIDLNDYLEKLTEPEDRETVANRAYQRELFEQYVTKDGNFPEQRAQLLEDFRAGKELTGPKGLRRKLGAFDLEYFGRAYLAHYFVRPSPKFHGELDRIWREGVLKGMNPEVDAKRISRADGCRRAIEAPRGHAKSTTFTFKDDLHAAVYGYKHYIIILSDSSEQAEGFLVDIKTELEENAALKEDFGELEGKVWKSSVILLANGVKIEAIGSGKKIRGRRHKQWRPDLIVCDDLENDENVNTPEQRKKLRDWFYKAVSKAGDTYTDIVYIGTLLHFDALLANVAKNPSYKSVRYSKKRKKAQKTQGFVTVSRTDMTGEAVKIPKGHVFKSILDINGEELRFFVLEAATLQKGASSVDVLVEAETEGSRYNVPAGQITRTLTYLGDVTFSNAEDWIVREGSDTEDDESARARTLRSWSELAQRATEDTFVDAAESVPGVLFAQADCNHPRGQGTVDVIVTGTAGEATEGLLAAVREAVDKIAGPYDNILVKSSVTVSQNISVTVTTDTADTDEAVENRIKAILTELLAVRRSRKLNELTLSDINHAIRSGYSGATNAAVSEPEADVKLGKDKVIILGDVSVTIERE